MSEKNVSRFLNPMKLLDATGDLLSSAVKSATDAIKSGPSVADRIAKMMHKENEGEGGEGGKLMSDGDAKLRIESYRVVVAVSKENEPKDIGALENAIFLLTLSDRKTGEHVHTSNRTWKQCETALNFVRSLCPKLEVPPAPMKPGGKTNVHLIMEERRKYIQGFCNGAALHPGANKIKEFHQLVEYKEMVHELTEKDAAPIDPVTKLRKVPSTLGNEASKLKLQPEGQQAEKPTFPSQQQLRHVEFESRKPESLSTSQLLNESSQMENNKSLSFSQQLNSSTTASSTTRTRSDSRTDRHATMDAMDTSTTEERAYMEECFRIMDVDLTGYITTEEMQDFIITLPRKPGKRTLEQCIHEGDKDNSGTFDVRGFLTVFVKLTSMLHMPLMDAVNGFRTHQFSKLYGILGAMSPEGSGSIKKDGSTYDEKELKAFLFLIKVSGVRIVSQQEVDKFEEATLTLSLDEFMEIMNLVTDIISLDEVFKALLKRRGNTKTITLINKYATKADREKVRSLKEKVKEYGGVLAGGLCANCEANMKEKAKIEKLFHQANEEKETLQKKVDQLEKHWKEKEEQVTSLSDSHLSKDEKIKALEEKLEEMEEKLEESRKNEEELLNRACDAEAELDLAMERQGSVGSSDSEDGAINISKMGNSTICGEGGGDLTTSTAGGAVDNPVARCNMYFLAPVHLGSNDKVPVVDMPGALVYELPVDFTPMGLVMDIYICSEKANGSEYVACRDVNGYRSLAWSFDGEYLCCATSGERKKLTAKKWLRLLCKIYWTQQVFDIVVDEELIFSKVAFRDADLIVNGIATLDIFPRNEVLLCYANMHFFK